LLLSDCMFAEFHFFVGISKISFVSMRFLFNSLGPVASQMDTLSPKGASSTFKISQQSGTADREMCEVDPILWTEKLTD